MPRPLSCLAALVAAAACALPEAAPATAVDDAGPADATSTAAREPRSWQQVMKRVEGHFDVVARQLGQSPPGDLVAVAAAATDAAGLLRLGYGELENPRVASFARMARNAESWLLRIAAEAGQGRGLNAQDLFRGGEARYCQRCHDAAEARRW